MLDRELAEHYFDFMLTYKPTRIVEVEAKRETAIGKCHSDMTLYIFDFETSSIDDKCHSVVIADSENHGIRVFVLMNLQADNLLPTGNDDLENQAEVVANLSGIKFPNGDEYDFQNALRIVESIRVVTWN